MSAPRARSSESEPVTAESKTTPLAPHGAGSAIVRAGWMYPPLVRIQLASCSTDKEMPPAVGVEVAVHAGYRAGDATFG
jgi:hypothetical protein